MHYHDVLDIDRDDLGPDHHGVGIQDLGTPGLGTPGLGIQEMARKYNCTQRALRFYEEKGMLRPARAGRQRLYSACDEIKLQLILQGMRFGLTLEDVQALILAKSEQIAFDQAQVEAVALLLPKKKIVDQIAFLTERRNGIDAAITALKEAERKKHRARLNA